MLGQKAGIRVFFGSWLEEEQEDDFIIAFLSLFLTILTLYLTQLWLASEAQIHSELDMTRLILT